MEDKCCSKTNACIFIIPSDGWRCKCHHMAEGCCADEWRWLACRVLPELLRIAAPAEGPPRSICPGDAQEGVPGPASGHVCRGVHPCSSSLRGLILAPTWCDICLAHKTCISKRKTRLLGGRDGEGEAERTLFRKPFTQWGFGLQDM